jgi:hypothetical protein
MEAGQLRFAYLQDFPLPRSVSRTERAFFLYCPAAGEKIVFFFIPRHRMAANFAWFHPFVIE